jgi:transposase-like protein
MPHAHRGSGLKPVDLPCRRTKQFGRPERLDAGQKRKIAARIAKGDASMAELAAEYGVGVATIWRAVQPEIAAA